MLNWPYRRILAAHDAWQRRRAVEEWEHKKQMHIAALISNTNMDEEQNNRGQRIEELEANYEAIKDMIWTSNAKQEPEEAQDDAFMRAGRRNLAKIAPPLLPGEESIQRLPG